MKAIKKSNKALRIVIFTYAIIWGIFFICEKLYRKYLIMNHMEVTYGYLKKYSMISDILFNLFGLAFCIVSFTNKELKEELKDNKRVKVMIVFILFCVITNMARIVGMIL